MSQNPQSQKTPQRTSPPTKRSLVFAGGGIKVAFQAGVLQVWLDEAALTFDHVDGASGGVFNLAMFCQGMTGTQVADNWRVTSPAAGISVNWRELLRLTNAESLLTLDGYRRNIFNRWGLDWDAIRASTLDATFNVYNFSRHQLDVRSPARMSEYHLVAGVSLPMWFPPIRIEGNAYVDHRTRLRAPAHDRPHDRSFDRGPCRRADPLRHPVSRQTLGGLRTLNPQPRTDGRVVRQQTLHHSGEAVATRDGLRCQPQHHQLSKVLNCAR